MAAIMQEKKQKASLKGVVENLKLLLANTYVLYLKTQNFHWNVEDARFHSLHEMFEEQYQELSEAIDMIAERIRVYDVKVPATMKQLMQLSTLEVEEEYVDGDVMVWELFRDHGKIAEQLRAAEKNATAAGDAAAADVFIERLRAHDKAIWMLRSHLSPSS